MSTTTAPVFQVNELKLAEHRLSDMVTTIEFTMISVIAGLMMFPLIEYATPLIRELRFEYWIYMLSQFGIVMFFWTALIAHALTFIGWPIDIGHNLLYLIVFPVVGIEMHFMSEPRTFYPMLVVITFVGAILPAYDLSLIRRRRVGAQGATAELYAAVYSRQRTLVYLSLGGLFLMIVMAVSVSVFPDFFIRRHMHVIFGFGLLAYILFLIRREFLQLNKIRGKILSKNAEQITEERRTGTRTGPGVNGTES